MKLNDWAKLQGICYTTAWRMFRDGRLPIPSEQLASVTIIVHPDIKASNEPIKGVALYARVSSHDQKNDLDRQLVRLTEYAVTNKYFITDTVKEVGSGLNGHRKGLMRLLNNPAIHMIIVEHKDRLMRFGFEYLEASLSAHGRTIVVMDTEEITDDIVRDLHDVIVSMCARLYGKCSAKNKAAKALAAIKEELPTKNP